VILGLTFAGLTPSIIMVARSKQPAKVAPTASVTLDDTSMIWGATIRPYALGGRAEYSTEKQFQFVTELFPKGACVRANVETNMVVNDLLVAMKQKYKTKLYLVLEEDMEFDSKQNYAKKAQAFADKFVTRYKGQIEYYQLMNEVTGVVFSKADDKGEKLDAGYGLTMDKTRYENVLAYTKALSVAIRKIDPKAQIVISGNWVLLNPVLQLIRDGVDVDIVGWNWGSGASDKPGFVKIDKYGTLNMPSKVHSLGKKFWIVESNRDDGSMGGKEKDQADYITKLANATKKDRYISGYFHFILTDTSESGPAGQLGLIKVTQKDGKWSFGAKKPAFSTLQKVASN